MLKHWWSLCYSHLDLFVRMHPVCATSRPPEASAQATAPPDYTLGSLQSVQLWQGRMLVGQTFHTRRSSSCWHFCTSNSCRAWLLPDLTPASTTKQALQATSPNSQSWCFLFAALSAISCHVKLAQQLHGCLWVCGLHLPPTVKLSKVGQESLISDHSRLVKAGRAASIPLPGL